MSDTEMIQVLEKDLREARAEAEKYRDKYVSQYEDSGLWMAASASHVLPWEKK